MYCVYGSGRVGMISAYSDRHPGTAEPDLDPPKLYYLPSNGVISSSGLISSLHCQNV
jgi:hypothetical protein